MEEAIRAALDSIAARPVPFAAEVVQAVLLVAIVAWLGRRPLERRLRARREKIAAALAEAASAERECGRIAEEARRVVESAEREAAAVVEAAREQAERDRASAAARVEAEARQAVDLARAAAQDDVARVAREASARLVRLTVLTARRYLDEVLTESERRALTARAISESLAAAERGELASEGAARGP